MKTHGGSNFSKGIIDFSASISPLGMHPAAKRALSSVALNANEYARYPDLRCTKLAKLLGRFWNFPEDQIILGAGAADLIFLIANVFFRTKKICVVIEPAFSEYAEAFSCVGGQESILHVSFEDFKNLSAKNSVVFLASPSNPEGRAFSFDEIKSIQKKCEGNDSVFVLDACFAQFSKNCEEILQKIIQEKDAFPNLIILNAFTKFYGLAGLRVGYALCFSKKLSESLFSSLRPWAISSVSENCALKILNEELSQKKLGGESSWEKKVRSLVKVEKERFYAFFDSKKIFYKRGEANFILFKSDKFGLESELLKKNIQIRSCADFYGLGENWYRISIKNHAENSILLDALSGTVRQKKNPACRAIMIQGTMSNAGKSLLAAALCRIFTNDGFRVAPFKSQNMALNSGVTADGLEMGRAQIMQAEASKKIPDVRMNPILLKPTGDSVSQVIVGGKVLTNMSAKDYFSFRKELLPVIKQSFDSLASENDIIVIEGAGSPAEINLRENDIVNMGLAEFLDAPVLLCGDIDRGGVFASLYGTAALLSESERKRIRGFLINKFRGDVTLLSDGLKMLEELTEIPVLGVVPFIKNLKLDDEDSLSSKLEANLTQSEKILIHILVAKLPYISNFTDFDAFLAYPFVKVSFFDSVEEFYELEHSFGKADLIILPGSKNSIKSMKFLNESKIDELIRDFSKNRPVIGICGGFQLLGETLHDSDGNEDSSKIEVMNGLSLLPLRTVFNSKKVRVQVKESLPSLTGFFNFLSGQAVEGYEIHVGESCPIQNSQNQKVRVCSAGNALGTYIHGFFDCKNISDAILQKLFEAKKIPCPNLAEVKSYRELKNDEFDRLEALVRNSVDINRIYEIMGIEL
ncbi:cobyric acid synthase [Treponema zioleckii]|uniref:cobyric acid synthase n=1 Tax=Treponema zioleckii TaxID=331680 RepID=UPI00168AF78A|nr:cobyric acid synthase [Treponema zioleckii]